MPSGSNMNWLKCKSKKEVSWVQGWLGKLLILSHTEVPGPALNLLGNWQKTSGLAWKLHSEWYILQGMRHAARQLMTAGVRMLPCFPCVGDGADYGLFAPQINIWKNSIKSMDHCLGSKRFSGTKNSWRARLFKSKRHRFWDYRFLKKWYCIYCRFINLRSCHDSPTRQSLSRNDFHFLLCIVGGWLLLWTVCDWNLWNSCLDLAIFWGLQSFQYSWRFKI